MRENQWFGIEESGLEQLKRANKNNNLESVGVQPDVLPATGAAVFNVGAVDPAEPSRLFTIVIDERGEKVDLKDSDRRRLFGGPLRPWTRYSYAVKFVCGTQEAADGCCCSSVRSGIYATEINIYNHQRGAAYLSKRVLPVVHGGLPLGREPRSVEIKGRDSMVLPAYHATMDDCCRINHLLFDAQPLVKPSLSIGFLEILSNSELQVTAVYTATDLESRSISIEVESIAPKIVYPFWIPIPIPVDSPLRTGEPAGK